MTFTGATIRELRALGLDQETFDKVLDIFERAKESKPKKKGDAADRAERGTRLPADWSLPGEYRQWAQGIGLGTFEIDREATKFKNYWLNQMNGKGLKLRWDLTWQNWCLGMLERAGRQPVQPRTLQGGTEVSDFSDETWNAIMRRYETSGRWNPAWGAAPGQRGCVVPSKFLPTSEMGP